jgi:hypothetical protein
MLTLLRIDRVNSAGDVLVSYKLQNWDTVKFMKGFNTAKLEMPDGEAEDQIITALMGANLGIPVNFTITPRSDDYTMSTWSSTEAGWLAAPTANTPFQELRWLLDVMFKKSNKGYKITIYRDAVNNIIRDGTIDDFDLSLSSSNPNEIKASFTFSVGKMMGNR